MKAKQFVDQSKNTLRDTMQNLQQALTNAENQENKSRIQQAIHSLEKATQQLNEYRD
jgi:ABC-type transporter Mla subunit MlaD